MSELITNAIVLRHAAYRESSRMLTLFSPTLGRLDVMCQGCRKQKSALTTASELFCAGEYVLYQRGERMGVKSCQIQDSFYPLREDVERLTHGALYLELCEAVVQPGQESERLFLFLLRTLAHLSYGQDTPRHVSAVFLLGFSSLTGFRPQVKRCVRCGVPLPKQRERAALIPTTGGLVCARCAGEMPRDALWMDAQAIGVLQRIMREGLDFLSSPQDFPDSVLSALILYAQSHVERQVKSARLLAQLLEQG